jgi:hypothetical protein
MSGKNYRMILSALLDEINELKAALIGLVGTSKCSDLQGMRDNIIKMGNDEAETKTLLAAVDVLIKYDSEVPKVDGSTQTVVQ